MLFLIKGTGVLVLGKTADHLRLQPQDCTIWIKDKEAELFENGDRNGFVTFELSFLRETIY